MPNCRLPLREQSISRFGPWILIAMGLILLLPGTASLPLIDRDEPRFARATIEMLERAEWAVPYFNDEYRFDKPPAVYWWMASSYTLLGVSELTARLHSVMAAIGCALLLFALGERRFSAATGFLAAAGFLSCLQTAIHGRLATADMLLLLTIIGAQFAALEIVLKSLAIQDEKGKRQRFSVWHLAFWTALGAGFLVKWPVIFAVTGITLILHRFVFWRKPVRWLDFHPVKGGCITLLLIAIWAIPAYIKTNGAFFDVGIGTHVIERGVSPFNDRLPVPGFYLLTAFISLFPWLGFLMSGWRNMRNQWTAENAYLASWLVGVYALFSIAMTQLPHYVLPAFPAFFLLVFQFSDVSANLDKHQSKAAAKPARALTSPGRFFWIYSGIMGAVSAVILILGILGWHAAIPEMKLLALALCLLPATLLSLLSASICFRHGRVALTLLIIVISIVPYTISCNLLRPYHATLRLEPVLQQLPPKAMHLAWGYTEPTLVFYSDSPWAMLESLSDADIILNRNGPRVAVFLRKEYKIEDYLKDTVLKGAPVAPARDYTDEIDALAFERTSFHHEVISGINLGRSTWVVLDVFYRE